MPDEVTLQKAELHEIRWIDGTEVEELGRVVEVQFNPETLKVSFSNQISSDDQKGGPAIQYVGSSTTKLSLDLVFDATVPGAGGRTESDVRELTREVVYFIQPQKPPDKDKLIPPGLRFLWGSFLFDGIVDSVNESLELFSEDGRPLRASVSLALSSQDIQFEIHELKSTAGDQAAGTKSAAVVKEGETLQDVINRRGGDWQKAARENGVENPRRPGEGRVIRT